MIPNIILPDIVLPEKLKNYVDTYQKGKPFDDKIPV